MKNRITAPFLVSVLLLSLFTGCGRGGLSDDQIAKIEAYLTAGDAAGTGSAQRTKGELFA